MKPYRELWTTLANVNSPELVKQIHKEYIAAGAEIITTNTFNSNPVSLELAGYSEKSSRELVSLAVNLAKLAREESGSRTIIAGCNAPAEDCYQAERTVSRTELEYNHKSHIESLWEAGADIIWNETHGHTDEIEIICEFCENNALPYAVNLYFDENLRLLSGEKLYDVVPFVSEHFPNAVIGFNCIAPNDFVKFVNSHFIEKPWGFYLNCGEEDKTNLEMTCAVSPDAYIEYVDKIIDSNTLYVGSCCGSNPLHTKKIKEYLIERFGNRIDSEN